MSKPKHILIIRLSAMGDVAMAVPVIRTLSQQYPEIKITILTRGFFSPFFRNLKHVSVFNADVKGKHKGLKGLYKLSKELKQFHFDAIADLHNVLRSKLLKQFLSIKPFAQIDKGRTEKKNLVSGAVFQQLKTTHQRYVEVFERLGFKIDLSNPTFPKPAVLSEKIHDLIKNDAGQYIGIAPFAAYQSKMYPLKLMDEVISELSKNYGVLLFGGGASEIIQLENLAQKHNNTINIAGKLTLEEEMDLISNLQLMLSMDSGNAHIAAMLGVKVVTIWSVTHPFAGFSPFNQPTDFALLSDRKQYPKIPTSVYGNKYPEDYKEAAGSITPETVIKKIKSIL